MDIFSLLGAVSHTTLLCTTNMKLWTGSLQDAFREKETGNRCLHAQRPHTTTKCNTFFLLDLLPHNTRVTTLPLFCQHEQQNMVVDIIQDV